MMKTKEIRELDTKKIRERILTLCQERLNLRLSFGTTTDLKTHRFSLIRREIARLKTILAERKKSMSVDNKKARTLEGKVVSNKMDKTAVVAVVRRVKHTIGKIVTKPLALKFMMPTIRGIGDQVLISECTPISKQKSWQLVSIVKNIEISERYP